MVDGMYIISDTHIQKNGIHGYGTHLLEQQEPTANHKPRHNTTATTSTITTHDNDMHNNNHNHNYKHTTTTTTTHIALRSKREPHVHESGLTNHDSNAQSNKLHSGINHLYAYEHWFSVHLIISNSCAILNAQHFSSSTNKWQYSFARR